MRALFITVLLLVTVAASAQVPEGYSERMKELVRQNPNTLVHVTLSDSNSNYQQKAENFEQGLKNLNNQKFPESHKGGYVKMSDAGIYYKEPVKPVDNAAGGWVIAIIIGITILIISAFVKYLFLNEGSDK